MNFSSFPVDSRDDCIACGGSLFYRDKIVVYHCADDRDPHLRGGYLCTTCAPYVEVLLNGVRSTECDWCSAPFPEAHRHEVAMYDAEDSLVKILSLCSGCYRD
jgi:hypothetical protein